MCLETQSVFLTRLCCVLKSYLHANSGKCSSLSAVTLITPHKKKSYHQFMGEYTKFTALLECQMVLMLDGQK